MACKLSVKAEKFCVLQAFQAISAFLTLHIFSSHPRTHPDFFSPDLCLFS
jgi:hypothetical protein